MPWINDFAKASFQIYAGNTLSAFQPLDFFHFYPLWYDLWIARIARSMERVGADHATYQELQELLPTPSNIRALVQKIIPSYRGFDSKNPEQVREVTNFFARMLSEGCKEDPWGQCATPLHRPQEIQTLVQALPWRNADPNTARTIGKFITAAGSLVHGLYNDLVTDLSWDCYGPYAVTLQGQEYSCIIRHFHDLQPKDLWPEGLLASVREIKIYALYQGITWHTPSVGCHIRPLSGNPVEGLRKYFVIGRLLHPKKVTTLTTEFAHKAEVMYDIIKTMDREAIKLMVMRQECYQLKKLFDAAGMDWEPTPEMVARVKNKPLLTGLVPTGKMLTSVEEYKEAFGITTFAQEVLGELSYEAPWLDEFCAAFARAVSASGESAWFPFDYYRLYPHPLTEDLDIARWNEVQKTVRTRVVPLKEIINTIPGPETIRVELHWMLLAEKTTRRSEHEQSRRIIHFLHEICLARCTEDPYGMYSEKIHPPQEVEAILKSTPWCLTNAKLARTTGNLLAAAVHTAYAYFCDSCYCPWGEIFGPYELGNGKQLIIKQYQNLQPTEVWPHGPFPPFRSIKLFMVYENAEITLDQWSHVRSNKNLAACLRSAAVQVDGIWATPDQWPRLMHELVIVANAVQKQWQGFDFEQTKRKVLELR